FHQAYGVEKSAVSDNFIASSREKLQELMERPLGELQLCAVLIDGTPFRDRQMMVALGINVDGRKTVLGLREGATENAAVVSELLGDLASRGLDFSVPRLYVLDGGKALAAAVRRHAGEAAMIQRCQVHKRRNVTGHLPEEHKSAVKKKLQNAYAMTEYADAKRALERLHRELMELNPSAARSLEEGMEETLTVHRLRVPPTVAPHPGQHQRDRVGVLDCGDGVPQRETLARRRPHRALGRLGLAGGRTPVPQSARLSRDPRAADGAGEYGFEERRC